MDIRYKDAGERARALSGLSRVVVKVGTRLLTDVAGASKADRVRELVTVLAGLRQRGLDVILVSSGAIGAGMVVLNTRKRPSSLPQLQAHAAVGQSRLMYLYETAAAQFGFHCAQLLLTAADVQDRERHLNVTSCLDSLLAAGVLPIINENDSVSVEEICFGDNDILAALVATMVRADLTVILTTVDGMWSRDADGCPDRRISVLPTISEQIRAMAEGTDGNRFSVGGMRTKLRAAELVTKAGEPLWIADGTDFSILNRVVCGEDVGTLCSVEQKSRMKARKRFLAFFSENNGSVTIDDGAAKAVVGSGRSLLPSGILAVQGVFKRGDTIQILDSAGREIARGMSYYSSEEMQRIRGCKSEKISALLGTPAYYEEAVHRNHLVLTA